MEELSCQQFVGERPLYAHNNLLVSCCSFVEGELPINECNNVQVMNCKFGMKYPVWYSNKLDIRETTFDTNTIAGFWYCNEILLDNVHIESSKNIRRCRNVTLNKVTIPNGQETLWHCNQIRLKEVVVCGDYFAMNSSDIEIDDMCLKGNHSFDGCKNVTVRNSKMLSDTTFWNCENVKVYDSFISGEYIGWNSKNLTFINCTIESLKGLCHVENLVMKGCKTHNTDLAFKYSTVDVEIEGDIVSIYNPTGGLIKCGTIGELILDKDKIDPSKTIIECECINKKSDRIE